MFQRVGRNFAHDGSQNLSNGDGKERAIVKDKEELDSKTKDIEQEEEDEPLEP